MQGALKKSEFVIVPVHAEESPDAKVNEALLKTKQRSSILLKKGTYSKQEE